MADRSSVTCPVRAPRIEQLTFFPRGGKRAGAGRKPKGECALVAHEKREAMSWHTPALVTMRLVAGLPTLRDPTPFARVTSAFAGATGRLGFQIAHFSVQSNHLHLIVEARNGHALGRGMKGLGGRMTKALEKLWGLEGDVFADRYHSQVLRSPWQVRNSLVYVLNNHRKHGLHTIGYCDPYSSGDLFDGWIDAPSKQVDWSDFREHPPCSRPRSYLLRKGWRRHDLLDLHEVPGRRAIVSGCRSRRFDSADVSVQPAGQGGSCSSNACRAGVRHGGDAHPRRMKRRTFVRGGDALRHAEDSP